MNRLLLQLCHSNRDPATSPTIAPITHLQIQFARPQLFKNFPQKILILENILKTDSLTFFCQHGLNSRLPPHLYKSGGNLALKSGLYTNAKKSNFSSFFFTSRTRGTIPLATLTTPYVIIIRILLASNFLLY